MDVIQSARKYCAISPLGKASAKSLSDILDRDSSKEQKFATHPRTPIAALIKPSVLL